MNLDPRARGKHLRDADIIDNRAAAAERPRLPPGQWVSKEWPVLHYGSVPEITLATWSVRVYGLVQNELQYNYNDLLALPQTTVAADIHCVTRWSLLDSTWQGISFAEIARRAAPLPAARYVMAHCAGGYTTNLPLAVLMEDDVLLCFKRNGQDLTPQHGWPLRLFVPKRYFWKSAKWLRALEFMAEDRLGFWEQAGYHNDADPWLEQRRA